MSAEMFEPTIPVDEHDLLLLNSGRLLPTEKHAASMAKSAVNPRIAMLSPSLKADLMRFERGGGSECVEVMAACLRHTKQVTIHLQCDEHVVPLTVFPREQLVHCPMTMGELIERHLHTMRVQYVSPALLQPPSDASDSLSSESHRYHPLAPLVWELAMRGPRKDLLPEIAGPAVYRIAPGLNVSELPASSALKAAVERLTHQTANLSEIAAWPALNRERAIRLLNALYLQASLIVSRSHPDAVRESWFGGP